MSWNGHKYRDRFGNAWSVRAESKRGQPTRVLFTCGKLRLIVVEDEVIDRGDSPSARLKELFCDAERVVVRGTETWYVGFRQRSGRGGRTQAGMHTRFRSDSGEVRFAKGMLHFRHMPEAVLCKHLDAAERSTAGSSGVRWTI